MAKEFKLQEKDEDESLEKGKNKKRPSVLGKEIVDGDFYHCYSTTPCGETKFNDVWYCNDVIKSVNPRNDSSRGSFIHDNDHYYPLTIEEVDEFTNWMTRNGDKAGIKAWDKYKDKLIKEAEMANYLRFNQLEEGNFYYVLKHNDEPENQFVWYKRDGHLKNPRCCSDTLNTSEPYYYQPLTLDDVDGFDEWMEKAGDCIGRIAWTAYKMKLREAEMAKNGNTEKKEEVDLYDPKFVYFDWDVSLKGKKVFFVNAIDYLKTFVRNHHRSRYSEIIDRSKDPAWPFFIDNDNWKFVYYDPNYEIKWAFYREGKKLQYREIGDEEWEDMVSVYEYYQAKELGPVYFDTNCRFEFRIKPEEEKKSEVEVNVDVKVTNTSSDGKIKITVNGKECIFENTEQARMVLNS